MHRTRLQSSATARHQQIRRAKNSAGSAAWWQSQTGSAGTRVLRGTALWRKAGRGRLFRLGDGAGCPRPC